MPKFLLLITLFINSSVFSQTINFPDNNFKLALLESSDSDWIAKNFDDEWIAIDSNNNGEIEVIEAQQIKMILLDSSSEITFSDISGIELFTNLEEIFIQGYDIPNVDLSSTLNLKNLTLSINNLESIIYPQNQSLEYLDVSLNNLTSFNKNHLSNLKYLDIHFNKIYDLDLSGLSALEYLDYSDNRDEALGDSMRNNISLTDCNSLQFLNLSFNHFETLDLSDLSNLSDLMCAGNPVSFPNSGLENIILKNCTNLKEVYLSENNFLESIDFSCSTELEYVHAWENPSLKFINLKNGVNDDNLNLYIDEGGSLEVLGIDLIETLPQLDPNIHRTGDLIYTPVCTYNTVMGKVSFDFDGNGCEENEGIQNIKINYESSLDSGFTFSQSDGKYIIYTKADNINLTPINDLFELWDFGLENPVNINFTNSDIVNYDFCLAPNTEYNDLEIHLIPLENARPGFDSDYKIVYSNNGNSILSGEIKLTYQEALMDFLSSSPPNSHSEAGLVSWNYIGLEPFETKEILFTMNMNTPTEEPPLNGGDILNFNVSISPIEGDETPDNNEFILHQTVVNSFDPNDKTCLQGEWLEISEVGEYVDYLIRFENTGSANAENIVVVDYIDINKFDLSSLSVINSSHNVFTRANNGNKIEFIFENIQLPFDDENNDGYVLFKIKTKSNLVVGDTFSNEVSIYFDYNAPIITNNYSTTIIENLNIHELQDKLKLQIYPNPTSDLVYVSSNVEVANVEIFDTTGKRIKIIPVQNQIISTKGLNDGVYLLKLNFSDNTSITKKLIRK